MCDAVCMRLIDDTMRVDQDVSVPMRNGVHLMVHTFRPAVDRAVPVLMSVTPYGKDATPDRIGLTLMRLAGVRFGFLDCSLPRSARLR